MGEGARIPGVGDDSARAVARARCGWIEVQGRRRSGVIGCDESTATTSRSTTQSLIRTDAFCRKGEINGVSQKLIVRRCNKPRTHLRPKRRLMAPISISPHAA